MVESLDYIVESPAKHCPFHPIRLYNATKTVLLDLCGMRHNSLEDPGPTVVSFMAREGGETEVLLLKNSSWLEEWKPR